ncbi:hypothetical protein CR513_34267, partial [Mucuna pruriens]
MELTFGVFQSQFVIVYDLHIKHVYTILHNMVVENERHTYVDNFDCDHVDLKHLVVFTMILQYTCKEKHVYEKQIH